MKLNLREKSRFKIVKLDFCENDLRWKEVTILSNLISAPIRRQGYSRCYPLAGMRLENDKGILVVIMLSGVIISPQIYRTSSVPAPSQTIMLLDQLVDN
ncbi:hypothetical protein WA026_019587 [Henosepilachna vigintioctopunctata]|uniref:Uncharacterized protein n=1 Tax=Henosepilachna vigintioctopunctata TaxID=420089 RepID=A0AAW1U0B4_9CUCU